MSTRLIDSPGTLRPLLRAALPVLAEQVLHMLVGFSDARLAGKYIDRPHLAAMSLLPERTREILEEYYFEDMSMAEIAQRHGIAGQRVQQIISETFPKMREAITQNTSPGEGVAARRRAEFAADVQELAQKAQIIDIAPRLASRSA